MDYRPLRRTDIARKQGLNMAYMSLAFARRQRFMASVLIGATTMEQLKTNLASATVNLSPEVIQGIEAVHRSHPNPCP
jgi:aryl-alcohol dehydrogenase-like predicted oxidoreductase